jgi:tRNA nucleotidyltransferase/poly(A) polymerase
LVSLGYVKVGKTHNVFLHPQTKDEYTLALNNSLFDELNRRDLTINSIAIDQETLEVIDPLGGISDIEAKVLRHNPYFKDDPVRLLRLMRFKAKFNDFKVAPETEVMVNELLFNTKLFLNIPKERVVGEFLRGFESNFSNRFIKELNHYPILEKVSGIKVIFSNIDTEVDLLLEEKIAISLLSNSLLTLKSFFDNLLYPKIISSFSLNLKSILTLKIETNRHELLEALELLRWNDNDGSFNSIIKCINAIGFETKGALLCRGREVLRSLDFKEIASRSSGESIAITITAAKFQALTKI